MIRIKKKKGSVAIYTALFIFIFALFLFMLLDIGIIFLTRQKAQNAADAASLAGAQEVIAEENPTSVVKKFAAENQAEVVFINYNDKEIIVRVKKGLPALFIGKFLARSVEAESKTEIKSP